MSSQTLDQQVPIQHVVAANVRGILARRGITSRAFAETLGVTPVWLSRRIGLTVTVKVTVEDLFEIAHALDVEPASLLIP